jgi:hypothetical protein
VEGVDHCTYLEGVIKYIVLIIDAYKILSNILLSRLTPYAEEITGDRQCVFRRNSSTTDCVFCIRQILERNGNTMRQCISHCLKRGNEENNERLESG